LERLLFFPYREDRDFFKTLLFENLGYQVFHCPPLGYVDEKIRLPHITDKDFEVKFIEFLTANSISFVYSENIVVRKKILEIKDYNNLKFSLNKVNEFDIGHLYFNKLLDISKDILSSIQESGAGNFDIKFEELAQLFIEYNSLFGQCSFKKFTYLYILSKSLQSGYILEIGVLYGKSLKALALGSKSNENVIVFGIDPWNHEKSSQKDQPGPLATNDFELHWDSIYEMAKINLDTFISKEKLQLFRNDSEGAETVVQDELLSRRNVKGEIMILHIDGNHDFYSCLQDWRIWETKLGNGGWVIIDDYHWPYGEGPNKLGNLILKENEINIEKNFIIDNSLFIQIGTEL
jgi:hypothetical protein